MNTPPEGCFNRVLLLANSRVGLATDAEDTARQLADFEVIFVWEDKSACPFMDLLGLLRNSGVDETIVSAHVRLRHNDTDNVLNLELFPERHRVSVSLYDFLRHFMLNLFELFGVIHRDTG